MSLTCFCSNNFELWQLLWWEVYFNFRSFFLSSFYFFGCGRGWYFSQNFIKIYIKVCFTLNKPSQHKLKTLAILVCSIFRDIVRSKHSKILGAENVWGLWPSLKNDIEKFKKYCRRIQHLVRKTFLSLLLLYINKLVVSVGSAY